MDSASARTGAPSTQEGRPAECRLQFVVTQLPKVGTAERRTRLWTRECG
jgi:hypothetical protein